MHNPNYDSDVILAVVFIMINVMSFLTFIPQFLSCVAPNVSYHPPRGRGMIRGVAVRLPQFVDYLDKHGISHKAEKSIRKKAKKNVKCAPRMKQYFLKQGVTICGTKVRRNHSICKGCLCVPRSEMSEDFRLYFSRGL